MFDRIKRAFGHVANAFRRLTGATQNAADATAKAVESFTVNVPPLRRQGPLPIPWSSMTKKGPGITAAVRRWLVSLTPAQRMAAKAKGWDRGMVTSDGRVR